jgi:LPXTG-motif cell wall-anchored protein
VRADGKLEFGLSSLSAGRTYSLRILATNAIGRSTSVTASVTTLTAAQVAAASAVTTVAPAATVVPATTVAPKSPVVKAKALPVTGQQGSNSTALLAVVLLLSGCGILVTNHRRKIRFHS